MKKKRIFLLSAILLLATASIYLFIHNDRINDNLFVTYAVDVNKQDLQLYWKDSNNIRFGSIEQLKSHIKQSNKKLLFAMNGGMYKIDNSPQGLYIEKQKLLSPLDTVSGKGNFYLKPNAVFYITNDNVAGVCKSTSLPDISKLKYATQSGPMLVIDGKIHKAFIKGSTNVNIRNGVGILPDGKALFVMSKKEINFYDFANYFKSMGCKNALYLDGFVSRMYLPEKKWLQTDGDFGVMIAVTEN